VNLNARAFDNHFSLMYYSIMTVERSSATQPIGGPKAQTACEEMGRDFVEFRGLSGRVVTRIGEVITRHIPHRRINAR
jgi:hypothetical protein